MTVNKIGIAPQYFYIVPNLVPFCQLCSILFTAIIIMCSVLNYLTPLYAHTDSALPTSDLSTNHISINKILNNAHSLCTSTCKHWSLQSSQSLPQTMSAIFSSNNKAPLSMNIKCIRSTPNTGHSTAVIKL